MQFIAGSQLATRDSPVKASVQFKLVSPLSLSLAIKNYKQHKKKNVSYS